jgi:pimeloyl-ACP methyl ester carboxylesterase
MHVCQAFYQQMQWVKAADIDRIPCAVLIVVGEGDKICQVHYSQDIKNILAQNPNRLVRYEEVPEASHQVMQERPDQVCTFIADFLRSLEGGASAGALDTETVQM